MPAGRAAGWPETLNGAAYADAVSEYAAQRRGEERAAARAVRDYAGSRLNVEVDQK